jgi:outer membrane protein
VERLRILIMGVVGLCGLFAPLYPHEAFFGFDIATADDSDTSIIRTITTLQEAIELGLANNHQLKAMAHAVAASKEEIGVAGSYRLPKISMEERALRTTNPTYGFMAKLNQERFTTQDFDVNTLNNPPPITDFQTAVSAEMPLFVPQIALGHDIARVEAQARSLELARKKEETVLLISKAYLMAITAKNYVAVAVKAREDAVEHRRLAQLRYDNDLGLYSDVLQAATAVTRTEQQLITAKNNAEIARRSLGLVLGLSGAIDVLAGPPELEVRDLAYYLESAKRRTDVKAMEERRRNADNNLKMARSHLLPNLGLGASYQLNDQSNPFTSEGESWQIAASLKWDLFEGMKRRHETNKAAFQVAEAETYLDGLRNAVVFQVNQAFLKAGEAAQNLVLAKAALKSATEGTRLVTVRYENSLAPLVALLDAQTALDQARVNIVAQENAHLLAVITLTYESGTILKDLGIGQSGKMEEDT